jgi:hypothetical protein
MFSISKQTNLGSKVDCIGYKETVARTNLYKMILLVRDNRLDSMSPVSDANSL